MNEKSSVINDIKFELIELKATVKDINDLVINGADMGDLDVGILDEINRIVKVLAKAADDAGYDLDMIINDDQYS